MLPLVLVLATTDYSARAGFVEGYNSNVSVSVSGDANVQKPALFSGLDIGFQLKNRNKWNDEFILEIGGRGRLYAPLADYEPQHDGTAYIRASGSWALSKRSNLAVAVGNSILTLNAAPAGNPFYRGNPFQSRSLQSVATLSSSLSYDFSQNWSGAVAVGSAINFTLEDPTVFTLPDGTTSTRTGFDALNPYAMLTLTRTLSERHSINTLTRYDYSYTPAAIDYFQNPPVNRGVAETHSLTLALGHGYVHQQSGFNVASRLGASVVTPPSLDPDKRLIISPYLSEIAGYSKNETIVRFTATYQYGSPFPRTGAGPGVYGALEFLRMQSPHGFWTNWAFLSGIDGGYTEATLGVGQTSKLASLAGSAEVRRSLFRGMSMTLGYNYRRTISMGNSTIPEVDQHLVYLGVAYLISTDQRTQVLATIESPPVAR